MTDPSLSDTNSCDAVRLRFMARLNPVAQWAVIVAISLIVGYLLELAGIPAALLLGPMAGGLVAGVNGASVKVPRLPYLFAQATVGILIASSLTNDIVRVFLADWPLFAGTVLATVSASSLLGYLISRWHILPGTTGLWGSAPGASTAMVLMAEAFGADAQLVAFMQYLRVIFVAAAAAIVARLFVDTSGVAAPQTIWFPPIEPWPFAQTLMLVVAGVVTAKLFRIPAGTILVPMLVGSTLHISGLAEFQLPQWMLAACYALVGWRIGLGFTREIVIFAARALPQIVASVLILIAICGGLALLLKGLLGVDMLTAYLATSPGGMDSVAIIAAASGHVNLPFVMALQTVRYFFVLLLGPPIARMIARRANF